MKKILAVFLFSVMLISMFSIALAEDSNDSDDLNDTDSDDNDGVEVELEVEVEDNESEDNDSIEAEIEFENGRGDNPNREGVRAAAKNEMERLRMLLGDKISRTNGSFHVDGRNITISELSDDQKAIIAGKINAKTGLNLTADDINGSLGSILRVYLSNGVKADVKVMPDRAAETALNRLRARCAENNCTVELKEVSVGNKTRAAWVVETEKDSRVFLIFKKKMIVNAEVDSETGQVISIHKPWWAFIAKEKNANETEIDGDIELNSSVNASN